ncbi:hypothetical protein GOFOIKOB_0933 [Methylobacterium tardum]|jgi:hypothetical protein|uniref:Secreted protein n=1 Tax=Methylobacterium tardum TaxID=374432 RepID=A0AA37TFW1_9HYPH|nr:hypothetical protein [Methylobacterium tardum]URD36439.1 hypothetical protein M6G65_29460 [Methylobacterium tardum]GJE47908.1 hypothetical protein GOFOIKOB_0933 [Methylobacterium tardum]GLS69452.1 hypothetical protein GCM10007890_14650 [Methylobacterium tardum]
MKRRLSTFAQAIGLAGALLVADNALAQESGTAAPSGRPANLCQELLAFVKQPEPAKEAAATPPQQATAVSNPSGASQGAASSAGGDVQQKSGLSGPTPGGSPNQAGTDAQRGPANQAKDAPAATKPASAPHPDAATIAAVEAAAAADDQLGCRSAARTMRMHGVALPPPLLALAALDPKFYGR